MIHWGGGWEGETEGVRTDRALGGRGDLPGPAPGRDGRVLRDVLSVGRRE